MARPTKTQAKARAGLNVTLARLAAEVPTGENLARLLPDTWAEVRTEGPPPQVEVTLEVDQDVLRFFRALGPGHAARMNLVLRLFMQARLAGSLEVTPPPGTTPEAEGEDALLEALFARARGGARRD